MCWVNRTASPRATNRSSAARANAPKRQANGFESLGADAELDQVIFDGSSFGTATPAGSDEEADYLGIPGLLDAEQMRDLLRRRQEEQLTKRTATGETRPVSTHGQLRELRRELNTLVSLAHHRTGKPYGWIHKELRRLRRSTDRGRDDRSTTGAHRRGARARDGVLLRTLGKLSQMTQRVVEVR